MNELSLFIAFVLNMLAYGFFIYLMMENSFMSLTFRIIYSVVFIAFQLFSLYSIIKGLSRKKLIVLGIGSLVFLIINIVGIITLFS